MLRKTTIYYAIVAPLTLTAVILFVNWLNWPVAAGIALGFALFVQAMYLANKLHGIWAIVREKKITLDFIRNLDQNMTPAEGNLGES